MTVHPICQSVFEKAFPASADAEVVRAVTEGVLLADDLQERRREEVLLRSAAMSRDNSGGASRAPTRPIPERIKEAREAQ
jgi:hypothetical protein